MATSTTPSFDFNVRLSMPSVVEAWKGTNRPYHHSDAVHLAAILKLLRRQAGRTYPGMLRQELARELVGLALACTLRFPSLTSPNEGDHDTEGDYEDLEDWEFLERVLDQAKELADRALADLESAVWSAANTRKAAA